MMKNEEIRAILEEFIRNGPEWTAAFIRLAKAFKEATPEQKQEALDLLEQIRKGECL